MEFTIRVKDVKVNNVSVRLIDFDLFLVFFSKDIFNFNITKQNYKVYFNNNFITEIDGSRKIKIHPKVSNIIPLNIKFNPTKIFNTLGKNIFSMLDQSGTIRIDMKLKVSLRGYSFDIPYSYEDSIKNFLI